MCDQEEFYMKRTPSSTAGSEEDFDVICDPCLNEGERVHATGHCIDCRENLCGSCFKLHRKFSALKEHDLRDKLTLSPGQKSELSNRRSAEEENPLTDRCPKHPEELVKFYCNGHHTLCCSVCIHLNHGSCQGVSYIRDISDGVAERNELKDIQRDLKSIVTKLTSTRNQTKCIKQAVHDSYSKTVTDISKIKKEVIELLDKLEHEMLTEASTTRDTTIQALDNAASICEDMIGEAGEIIVDIEKKKRMRHINRLFISMKTAQDKTRSLSDKANEVSGKIMGKRVLFQPDKRLTELLSTLTSLGSLSLVHEGPEIKAKYIHDIVVASNTDTDKSSISGVVVLPDGHKLVLTDYSNLCVKLIDVLRRNVIEQIKLKEVPVDLTVVKADKVAVILKGKRYIRVISACRTLSKSHTIAVPGLYNGIEHFKDKLFLACIEPIRGVQICDMSGSLRQQIETDCDGNKLFTWPSRIAINPEHGVLHVTDYTKNTVMSFTMDGTILSKYENERLKRPRGITVDDGGCVYVCSYNNHYVHQLSPDGHVIKTLLEKKCGLMHPYAIAHSAGTLYISNDTNIKVYRLERINSS